MTQIASAGQPFWAWTAGHRVELALSFRVTTSAVLSLVVSDILHLPIPLWAVLTAVILTQLSVGKSLKATTDYFIGTVGAAIYAGAVGVLLPGPLWANIVIAVGPAALLAALNLRFSAAPFTAVLVVLAPTITHFGPIASAVDRVLEVAVGGTVGLLVSLLVFPARAHDLALQAAAATLDLMARLQSDLFAKLTHPIDEAPLGRLERSISEALARLDASSLEARHERVVRLGTEPDQGPLVRTVSRLRHDQIMIARAGLEPLPEIVQARLKPWLTDIGAASATYLQACAGALRTRRSPRPANAVMAALDGYAAEMAALRREGLTRELPSQSVEQVFTLSFALDQLRRHLVDLERSVAELAASLTRSGQS